jgi:branched-subunit amino acid transport protein AzlD
MEEKSLKFVLLHYSLAPGGIPTIIQLVMVITLPFWKKQGSV